MPHQTEAASSTTVADPFTEAVAFTTSDGIQLAGTLFGNGDVAVVLAHQGTPGADQTTWYGFGELLAERGYTALAFDFRGIGESGGTPDRSKLDTDLLSALQFLRDEGHEEILCFGASMGGTTCIQIAINGYELAGLVALGSAMITGYGPNDLEISEDDLGSLTLPKAFIAAENDTHLVVGDITRMYEASPKPKALYLLPGSAHGTDLFKTDSGSELTTILLDFLESVVDRPCDRGESGSESPREP
jgi:pimeloyl-ACP methyl ester carboxylesterase